MPSYIIMDWAEKRSSYGGPFVYVYSSLLFFFNSFSLKQRADRFLLLPPTIQSETALSKARSLAGRMQDAASLIKFASRSGHRLHFWAVNRTWRLQLGQMPAIPKALPAAPAASAASPGDTKFYWQWQESSWRIKGICTGTRQQVSRARGACVTPKRRQQLQLMLLQRCLPDLS